MKKRTMEVMNGGSRRSRVPGLELEGTVNSAQNARLRKVKALFLIAAGLSFVASVSLWFLSDREQGLFVGLWVPSILALGCLLLQGQGGKQ